jgi:hypothetical protein
MYELVVNIVLLRVDVFWYLFNINYFYQFFIEIYLHLHLMVFKWTFEQGSTRCKSLRPSICTCIQWSWLASGEPRCLKCRWSAGPSPARQPGAHDDMIILRWSPGGNHVFCFLYSRFFHFVRLKNKAGNERREHDKINAWNTFSPSTRTTGRLGSRSRRRQEPNASGRKFMWNFSGMQHQCITYCI